MVEPERVQVLARRPARNAKYVLYWMQAAQRATWNPALEQAILLANEHKLPVVVLFVVVPHYPEANLRPFAFMLQGLAETARVLAERGVAFVGRVGDPVAEVLRLAQEACCVVLDRGYLRHQRAWRKEVAQRAPCSVVQVEGEVVVPVELAYPKAAWSAAVLRPRVQPLWPRFLRPQEEHEPEVRADTWEIESIDWSDPEGLLKTLPLDRSVPPVPWPAGTAAARAKLHDFINNNLDRYAQKRSDPLACVTSQLSPYLHFGHISPVEVAWKVQQVGGPGAAAFLEELLVRRELAVNFVFYNPRYDAYGGLPAWARATLGEHAADRRPAFYSLEELDRAQTDDPLWNAIQTELRRSGWVHNYLRMYWGKQFLRWVPQPEEAHRWALALNNRYFLDGRDPASFTNVGWCFGLHDRPFPERPVFGKVRAMTPEAQKHKFDVAAYIARVGAAGQQGG